MTALMATEVKDQQYRNRVIVETNRKNSYADSVVETQLTRLEYQILLLTGAFQFHKVLQNTKVFDQ